MSNESYTLYQPFNPMDYDPTQGIGQLPVGRHKVVSEKSVVKENNSKTGGLAEFILRCIEGPAAGQKQAFRLNIYHSDPQTKEIAHKKLSTLCHCVGVYQLGADGMQLQVLNEIPFYVDIAQQLGNEKYTEVAKMYDINGNEPTGQGGQRQASPQGNRGAQGNGSWGNNGGQQQPQQNNGGGNQNFNNNQQPVNVQQSQPQQTAPQNNGGGGRPTWAN